jgi:hypothetical protein
MYIQYIQKSEYDSEIGVETLARMGEGSAPRSDAHRRGACEVRRMLERRAELKWLREFLDEPDRNRSVPPPKIPSPLAGEGSNAGGD